MKRFISVFLAVVMALSMVPAALAAEGDPAPQEFYVKYGATNIKEVWNQMAQSINPTASYSVAPHEITEDLIITVDGVNYPVHCVKPTYSVPDLPSLDANSEFNQNYSRLTSYIRDNLTYTQTNPAYDSARGTARVSVVYPRITDSNYVPTGTTYNLTVTINGSEATTRLVVNPVDSSAPDVSISTGRKVYCSPEVVEYSLDRRTWTRISNGDTLPSSCGGNDVYFRTPASFNTAASDWVEDYCKEDQTGPQGRLQAEANSYSVWITNASDFSGCEFSIDGNSYGSRTSWENLQPSTRYTVYARYPSDRYAFASPPTSVSVSTTEGPKTELKYNKVSTSDTIYIQAEGTAALTVNNKTLTAAYTDQTVRALKNDITNNSRKTDVVTTLDVHMTQEESDDRVYNKVKFTMPRGMGLLQLRLHTPWFTVIRDEETTEVNLQEGVQGYNASVKAWANGLTHVYKVETNKKGEVTILFPWEWPDRADLDGLRVSYIDLDGKNSRTLNYGVVTNGIQFVMPANGYFAIRNLYRPYPTTPFNDCQTGWAYPYICHAYETGLVAGTSATTFSPEGEVTRSQLVMLMARMRGFDNDKWYGDIPYTDVKESDWYARALSFCYAAGVIKLDGPEFKPAEPVTRAETIALAEALFPYKGTLWTPFNCSDRDSVPTYALRPMDALYTCGIVNGTSPTTFSPSGKLSRAEIVTILYRLQVADYWQTRTVVLKNEKLDSKFVKSQPNIWVDDGADYFDKKTSDVQGAMQYFFNTTGVRPYLVTTDKAKDAGDIYTEKFQDNGHAVFLITKLNDRGGVDVSAYVGSDAKVVIGESELDVLMDKFEEYWNSSTLTASEAVTAFFRTGADDIMSSEITSNPTGWHAPTPVRDYSKTAVVQEQPEPQEQPKPQTQPISNTTYAECKIDFTDNDFIRTVKSGNLPAGFSAYTRVDDVWESSSGTLGRWNVTILKSKSYSCVRFSNENITESINLEEFGKLFGMNIDAADFMRVAFANSTCTDLTIYDIDTASTLRSTETAGYGQILIDPPQSVVPKMLEVYKN